MEDYDLQNLLNTVGFVDIEVGLISVCEREGDDDRDCTFLLIYLYYSKSCYLSEKCYL